MWLLGSVIQTNDYPNYRWSQLVRIIDVLLHQENGVHQSRALYLPPIMGEEKHFCKCRNFVRLLQYEMTVLNCSPTFHNLLYVWKLSQRQNSIKSSQADSRVKVWISPMFQGLTRTLPDRAIPWNTEEIHTWTPLSTQKDFINFIV